MDSLLNPTRPAVFCPGCSHERVLHALDRALTGMGLTGSDVVIVTDIGCSGLFDTFFDTHALHGLHGRALTYATGIKLARPECKVIVTMGDGGLGIGGAHVLSTCRRNIDLTLLVLNNFNYGMTGGQCSSTTPPEAAVASGFLNRLEKPIDIGMVAGAAGATMVARASAYQKDLVERLQEAIAHNGFSLVDIWGICPGRYTRRNRLTPQGIVDDLAALPPLDRFGPQNRRPEYGAAYRQAAAERDRPRPPRGIDRTCTPPTAARREVVLLGRAGQRIITAGELLCLAGAAAGGHATQKNDYPITVMRGHSVTEVILDASPVDYTGIENPSVVVALAPEGVARRRQMFAGLSARTRIVKAAGIELPDSPAAVTEVDFGALAIKPPDWALAALAVLARRNAVLTREMLTAALRLRFTDPALASALAVVERAGA